MRAVRSDVADEAEGADEAAPDSEPGAGDDGGQGAITGIPPTARVRERAATLPRLGTVAMLMTSATSVGHASPRQGCTRSAPRPPTCHGPPRRVPPCVPALLMPRNALIPGRLERRRRAGPRRAAGPGAGRAPRSCRAHAAAGQGGGKRAKREAPARTERPRSSRGPDQWLDHRTFTRSPVLRSTRPRRHEFGNPGTAGYGPGATARTLTDGGRGGREETNHLPRKPVDETGGADVVMTTAPPVLPPL